MKDWRIALGLGRRFAATALRVTLARARRGPQRPRWSWTDEWVATAMRRHFAAAEGRPWPEQRRSMRLLARASRVPAGVRCERGVLGGRPALTLAPAAATRPARPTRPARTLLFLHGGAYLFGSPDDYVTLVGGLVRRTGFRAVVPDYRLAPEHPFPAALEDARAAWEALLAEADRAPELVLAGDSAGGGLALALLAELRDAGRPLPARAALIGPWVDLTARGGSIDAFDGVDVFTPGMIARWAALVLAGAPPDDPRASPLHGDLSGLPPLLVQTGGVEMLRDQDEQLAARARAAGTDVTLRVWDDCIHDWPAYAPLLRDGRRALDEVAAFLAR